MASPPTRFDLTCRAGYCHKPACGYEAGYCPVHSSIRPEETHPDPAAQQAAADWNAQARRYN